MYECPKCSRYGMEWDGRAKVLVCYYNTCNHVIRIQNQKDIPNPDTISVAIERDSHNLRNENPENLVSTS